MPLLIRLLFLLTLYPLTVPAGQAASGVTSKEIVVGSLQDLSGPIAALGVHFRNGTQMRFDEENAQGGIHGRKLRLVIEDTGYDPKRAILAAQKFIQRDHVFAVIHNLGSPVVMSTMPLFLDAGILHLFPAAPLKEVYAPVHPLKFAMSPSYAVSVPPAIVHLVRANGYKRVGILYQDDEMGHEVLRGLDAALAELKLPLCEKAGYKRGATDFSSQIARLRAADCDFVVLATVVRETIGAYSEARRNGWQAPMLVTASGYTAQVPQLGGKVMDGLYGVVLSPHPYAEGANKRLAEWISRYTRLYGVEPNTWDVMAYAGADIFIQALRQAGPNPTTAKVSAALEHTHTTRDFFGNPDFVITPTDHLANRRVRIAQVVDGRWRNLTDYLQ
ncbi:MAG: ABC transporter substrate-binding protein [Betaproteobacteria bacterium]|nr:ABC transporter substrate-binding protein [Betaproteobacteria bacterium]